MDSPAAKRELIDSVIVSKINSSLQDAPLTGFNGASNLGSLGIDSLGVMEIILECEKMFGCRIPDKKIANIFTKEDIYRLFEV